MKETKESLILIRNQPPIYVEHIKMKALILGF